VISNGGASGTSSFPVQLKRCPLLIVLSGPSGVGKTTITGSLVDQGWQGHVVVTATTRKPRAGELDGIHYHFRTMQQFQHMVETNDLLEHAEVHGNWYGVPATPVREQLAAGRDVILTIDPQGHKRSESAFGGSVCVSGSRVCRGTCRADESARPGFS